VSPSGERAWFPLSAAEVLRMRKGVPSMEAGGSATWAQGGAL